MSSASEKQHARQLRDEKHKYMQLMKRKFQNHFTFVN